jgi:hypothetical protein
VQIVIDDFGTGYPVLPAITRFRNTSRDSPVAVT